ncbi:MAG: putative DNA binding domain-containing protein [Planctomycetes bacterium]|nr:putative DNA binding domain-containing protein [Planctomycetota bacterium]
MTTTVAEIDAWLQAAEGEHLEFKEAKQNFHFEKLLKYCAALANEGGGAMVLGVTDNLPRQVVGTQAFEAPERTKAGLIERLHLRVAVDVVAHPLGRVLVFRVPSRALGSPVDVDGAYWMRAGEDLVTMTQDQLRRILDEAAPDFSAAVCSAAKIADLDARAIAEFRRRWRERSKIASLAQNSDEQLLRDAELLVDGGVTYAALVLLGSHQALGRHLANAELIFEYRSTGVAGPANQREEFREGFLLFYDRLWELVNLRNDRQHYQDGLFMREIATFNEGAVREALLNAVAHRDYRNGGSVFVRQFPRRIEIVSPGGFPEGITAENCLDKQRPRNRRIADALARCGLVERAGQGVDRIFESCLREGKELPDFTHTDAWQVALTLHGQVGDARFVRFLERVGAEQQFSFDTHELLVLDRVHRELPVPEALRPVLRKFLDLGVVESVGRGRGTRYFLSRRFHAAIGERAQYTRRKGLDHEASKELLYRHLRDHSDGCPFRELEQVLPGQSRGQIKVLLNDLRAEGRAHLRGVRRWARWFPDRGLESPLI